jgi:hypothetical protein
MSVAAVSGSLARTCAKKQLPAARAVIASCQQQQQRYVSDASKSSFDSPFSRSTDSGSTLKIPDFSKYSSKGSPRGNQVFSYFVAGTMGLVSAVGAKATVQGRFSAFLLDKRVTWDEKDMRRYMIAPLIEIRKWRGDDRCGTRMIELDHIS